MPGRGRRAIVRDVCEREPLGHTVETKGTRHMHDYDEATAETVAIRADEIDANDIFPSHDGDAHDVAAVTQNDEGQVFVNVRKRHSGETYSTEFAPDHIVRVLAFP